LNKDKFLAWKADPDSRVGKRLFGELVKENLPFAKLQMRRTLRASNCPYEEDDMLQAATEGLIEAFYRYDPEKAAFTTFAAYRIMYAVQCALRSQLLIHRPQQAAMPYRLFVGVSRWEARQGRQVTAEELACTLTAQDLGVDPADLETARVKGITEELLAEWRTPPLCVSIHEPHHTPSLHSEVGDSSREDTIPDPKDPFEGYHDSEQKKHLLKLAAGLRPELKTVVQAILSGKELSSYASAQGIEQSEAQRRLKEAVRILRKRLAPEDHR